MLQKQKRSILNDNTLCEHTYKIPLLNGISKGFRYSNWVWPIVLYGRFI